jgi:serine/threonine protein kinase
MSPEQRRGDAPAETWDLWALAVVAFEMLTGTHPFAFSVESRSEIAVGWRQDQCFEASALTPSVRAFFEHALAPDCSRRPMSIRHFIDELEKALAGQ